MSSRRNHQLLKVVGCMVQVAQLVLLAQAGAWVPAASMRLSVMDAVHTRMGAHDNILQVRSLCRLSHGCTMHLWTPT